MGAKSLPSAPRPCNQITEAVGVVVVSISMGWSGIFIYGSEKLDGLTGLFTQSLVKQVEKFQLTL